MTEETFGPTLPIMKVARRRRGRAPGQRLARTASAPRSSRATPSAASRSPGACEAGAANVNDAMINYTVLELPMGGAKASGLGSRHGAGGIRKYCSQQAIVVTPRWRMKKERFMYPYKAPHLAAAGGAVQAPVRPRQARLSRGSPTGARVRRRARPPAQRRSPEQRARARGSSSRRSVWWIVAMPSSSRGREVEGQVVDEHALLGAARRRARRRARTCAARACGCPPRRRSRRRRRARRTGRAG